jgi:tRNA A37 threonylcarbamoyladenosine modification protein TsaB
MIKIEAGSILVAAIEASTPMASLALASVEDDSLHLYESELLELGEEKSRGATLEQMLTTMLRRRGIGLESLDLLALGGGPGPSDGLPSLITRFEALAASKTCRLAVVSSIEALASSQARRSRSGTIIVPVIGESPALYSSIFRVDRENNLERLAPDIRGDLESLRQRLVGLREKRERAAQVRSLREHLKAKKKIELKKFVGVGDGFLGNYGALEDLLELPKFAEPFPAIPLAVDVLLLAARVIHSGQYRAAARA